MLRIRLQRRGRKKRPVYHVVVADGRAPRDGRIVEDLGRFYNLATQNDVRIDESRAIYWINKGAQPSDTVRSILKKQGVLYKMHLQRWGKSDEEIDAALEEWRESRKEKVAEEPSRKEKRRAMLEAEEKEFQKQLQKKAEEAAREKQKQEALASSEEEEAAEEVAETAEAETQEAVEADAKTEAPAEETAPAAEEEQAETTEAEAPEEETAAEAETETVEEPEAEVAEEEAVKEAEETPEPEAKAKAEAEEEVEAPAAEADAEETAATGEEAEKSSEGQTSVDLLAKEAIDHIESSSLDELEGFITEDEDRVTVQRAWEKKQEEG